MEKVNNAIILYSITLLGQNCILKGGRGFHTWNFSTWEALGWLKLERWQELEAGHQLCGEFHTSLGYRLDPDSKQNTI